MAGLFIGGSCYRGPIPEIPELGLFLSGIILMATEVLELKGRLVVFNGVVTAASSLRELLHLVTSIFLYPDVKGATLALFVSRTVQSRSLRNVVIMICYVLEKIH